MNSSPQLLQDRANIRENLMELRKMLHGTAYQHKTAPRTHWLLAGVEVSLWNHIHSEVFHAVIGFLSRVEQSLRIVAESTR